MTFLNISLLLGVLAFNIPVIIYLLNRSKFRTVKWGAMHLLEPVVRVNRRRIKLEQLILLLIRAMIPVMLALAMAAPVLTGCQNLAGNSRSSLVVLLDNSYSMSAGGANSSFNAGRDATLNILRDLREGSDVSVVLMAPGSPVTDEPTTRVSMLADALKKASAAFGSADAPTSLQLGSSTIERMQHPKRDMVVITDFQRISWSAEQGDARARVAQWMKSGDLTPSLTFLHVGRETTDNVAIMDANFSRLVVGVGQRVLIRANLKNFGERSYPSMRVYLDVDNQRKEAAEVSLGPGEDGQALFTHSFDQPGSHVVKIWADADATLKEDNEFLTAVQVLDRVPVLLVDGDPAPAGEPLRGETGFLEIALQPHAQAGRADLTDLLQSRVVRLDQFNAKSIASEKAIVLANVPSLSDEQLRVVETFVRTGGGLIVFPGNRVDANWYNAKLFSSGAGLLPAHLTGLAGSLTDANARTAIVSQGYTHPALTSFNDRRNGNLSTGEVWVWFKLASGNASRSALPGLKAAEIPERTSSDAGESRETRAGASRTQPQPPGVAVTAAGELNTLARFETGDPFLVEKRFGEGTVILCATACDGDWSSLPVRPFFVPLMQQLASYAASNVEPPRNVTVGQPLLASLPKSAAGQRLTLTDPAGRTHAVVPQERGPGAPRAAVEFKATQELGLYTLTQPGEPGAKPVHFVVSSPRRESDLRQLGEEEIRVLAQGMNADVVRTLEEYRDLDKKRRHGREVWDWFFYAVLALFFAELFLEQKFAGR